MIFIDGVGIGKKDYEYNPFFKYGFKTFENVFGEIPHLEKKILNKDDVYLFPTDANLGVEGLPQSGTGQVSIFCGINACLLYTSDAADERSSVDLGGRRIIKKKIKKNKKEKRKNNNKKIAIEQ